MTTSDYTSTTGVTDSGTASGQETAGIKEQVKQTTGTATDEAKNVAGVAAEEAKDVAGEAKTQVRDLIDQATSQIDDQSRQQKDRLAGTMRTLSNDLDSMAAQTEGRLAADLAREVADRARSLSNTLEDRDPRDLLDDIKSFARRKPGTFLLGAVAAGVVAGRLTRGAKKAQSSSSGTATLRAQPVPPTAAPPGELSTATPSPSGTGLGTAGATPLQGTGPSSTTPATPVAPVTGSSYDPSAPGGRP